LIHGQAIYSNDLAHLTQFVDNQSGDYLPDYSWFMPSKKALLAPFGVGTVDQALLSVLMARHFFVRLYGLGCKTVIFDEIHAYDVYMSQLFQRLLEWLCQLGTSVILLSATLPEKTRRELVAAYSGISTDNLVLPTADYPRLTCSSNQGVKTISLQKPPEKELSIEWINRDPASIQEFLQAELETGGCAAVLCNTVARAQEVFSQLSKSSLAGDTEITLFHARFPMAWRERIEKPVLADFGKGGRRPRAVVVATQVIEQSLDLDFDLMVTDLAPVDLLLQRAGRLHRHEITNRPERLQKARLIITRPGGNWDVPEFDRDRFVYDEYILLRTYQVMKQKQKVLPISETTDLIETVYGNLALPDYLSVEMQKALDKSLLKMKKDFADEVREAKDRLIYPPEDEDFIYQPGLDLEEDDPTLHKSLQALTRLTEPSICLVCLHQTPGGLAYEPDGKGAPLDVTKVFPEQSFEFLRRSITIQNREVVAFFSGATGEIHYPAPWKKNSALRHQRLAVFKDGYCEPEGMSFVLKLTRELGLEVIERR
jgi:CRISPR-associated endonuclease/helicase Cas3